MKRLVLMLALVAVILITGWSYLAVTGVDTPEKLKEPVNKARIIYDRAEEHLSAGRENKAVSSFVVVMNGFPGSEYAASSLEQLARIHGKNSEYEKARYYYKRLLERYAKDPDRRQQLRAAVERMNMELVSSPQASQEDAIEYEVKPGDTLYDLARKFNTTVALIKKMNGLSGDNIRVGQDLMINVAEFSILVDKARSKLFLKKDGRLFKTYTVATGEKNSTPVGEYEVTEKMVRPAWTKPGVGIVLPDSEEYELGARWLGISKDGYGIHGTNDNSSLGRQSTAGCVRMKNEDVIELYDIVPPGTTVRIIDSSREEAEKASSPEDAQKITDKGTTGE